MQYGVDVPTYKRVGNEKNKSIINLELASVKWTFIIVMGLMLGRVGFGFIEGLYIAPFGIAYLLSVINKHDTKASLIAAVAVSLGYLSQYNINPDNVIYISVSIMLLLCGYIYSLLKKDLEIKQAFVLGIVAFVALGVILGNQGITIKIIFSLIKALLIIPFFYILNYAIRCIEEINTNYFFSTEELISIAIFICLVVSGVGEVSIMAVSVRNIIAISFIVIVAYSAGSSAGAILGVTMGMVIGVTSNNMIEVTCLYSVCGLIVGVFRETGKIFSVLAYLVAAFMIIVYSQGITRVNLIEIVTPAIIMLIVPTKFIKDILKEINNEEKSKIISDIQTEGIKSEFIERLQTLKNVMSTIGASMENLSENDKLLMKNKGTAMVENLADRVCQTCEMNRKCWERELHSTFSEFTDLMLSCESKRPTIPKGLNGKCVKRTTLLKSAEELFSTYTVNEVLKSRLAEGRKLIAKQMNNISYSLGDILRDFEKDVSSCLEIDKLLRKTLTKNKIKYKEIYSFTDKKGRLKIKVKLESCNGGNYCIKNILPIISNLIKTPLCLSDEGCKIDPYTDECCITIEETPRYHVVSSVAFSAKDGEKYSGDSYSFGKNNNGEYITAISDGMGSGPEAGLESSIAIDLVEKFMECGFSENTTLNTVNSIMAMKFDEDEKFTTLDMSSIDLYTGEVSFIKVGGGVSFIKRGSEVEVIDSSNLPFGVIDEIDVNSIKSKIKNGDIIITISDGILDVDRKNIGEYSWLEGYLEGASLNPDSLAREILDKAKGMSGGRVLDDMTVVVSKLYSVY